MPLLEHIKFLASDDLKGRGNGERGLERAAEYIAEQFKAAGLQPGGAGRGWFQPFELHSGSDCRRRERALASSRRPSRSVCRSAPSYYPLAATPNESRRAPSTELDDLPLVFAGYGISAPVGGYDDYAGLDVNGKAVLIFTHEPQERDATAV